MTRQKANLEICKHITDFFLNPENEYQRFWQGIYNLGVIDSKMVSEDVLEIKDDYNMESIKTLHKLKII